MSGPTEGGTRITVRGFNLGKDFSDISVKIGNLRCDVQSDHYLPSNEYVSYKYRIISRDIYIILCLSNMNGRSTHDLFYVFGF